MTETIKDLRSDIRGLKKDIKEDIRELHTKSNIISLEIAKFSGEYKEKFKHLATKTDLINTMGSHVKDYHQRSSVAPKNGRNTKVIVSLVGGIITAIGALVAVIYALIQ